MISHYHYQSTGTAGMTRESFFDYLQGPNENRFIPFNNMPSVCSKFKVSDAPKFDKYVTREQGTRSERDGGCLSLNAKQKEFLQDYDYNYEINKEKINRGGGKNNYLFKILMQS